MGEKTITDPKIGDWAEHDADNGSRVQITQITMQDGGDITYRMNVIEQNRVIGTVLVDDLDYFNDGSWVWHDRTQMGAVESASVDESPSRAVLRRFTVVQPGENVAPRTSFLKSIMGWMR